MTKHLFPYLPHDPIDYLTAPRRPDWVKYQTLVCVLGTDANAQEVEILRTRRDSSASVKRLRSKQLPDGSFPCSPWRHVHKFYFNQLVQMGYSLRDPTVRSAVDSLLKDQLPGGGYNPDARTAKGAELPLRRQAGNWSPCMTAFITNTFLDLGMRYDEKVERLLEMLQDNQRESGGWICRRSENDAPYCILGATGWAFVVLTRADVLRSGSESLTAVLCILEKHKNKIARHGYHRDMCYRCDEALLLPSLSRLGLTMNDSLFRDLYLSLVNKQQSDGSWAFGGKTSPWYTLEVVKALQAIEGNRVSDRIA